MAAVGFGAEQVDGAARLLARARLERRPLDGLPSSLRPPDEARAYAVQEALHDLLTAAGAGEVVGYKIGCTTPVMQAYLGIPNPCAGGIFAPTVAHGEARLAHDRYLHVGVECELAVRLGADLSAAGAPWDRAGVGAAVAAVMPAIEIVDSRWVDYRRVDTPTLIADDFFGAGCVLGEPVPAWRALDLAALRGTMSVNGVPVGEGRGADILGHPLEALAWLASSAAVRGRPLGAGAVVLLGSLVATRWLGPGDEARIEVDGLGGASVHFD